MRILKAGETWENSNNAAVVVMTFRFTIVKAETGQPIRRMRVWKLESFFRVQPPVRALCGLKLTHQQNRQALLSKTVQRRLVQTLQSPSRKQIIRPGLEKS